MVIRLDLRRSYIYFFNLYLINLSKNKILIKCYILTLFKKKEIFTFLLGI